MAVCPVCQHSHLRCDCLTLPGKADEVTGNIIRDGVEWCGKCHCRVISSRCTNALCSTNKIAVAVSARVRTGRDG